MTTQEYIEAIRPILGQHQNGMHVNDIVQALVGCGLVATEDEKEKHKIQSIVSIKSKKKDDPFVHVINKKTRKAIKGMYTLRRVITKVPNPTVKNILPSQAPDGVSTTYTGTGGEYLIMSELLFQGYNVNKMTVDDGEDIIATKNDKFYFLQIKTSYLDANLCASFSVKLKRFNLFKGNSNMYYSFVIRAEQKSAIKTTPHHIYFTFNTLIVEHYRTQGLIGTTPSSITIKIKLKDNKPYLYNNGKEEDISQYQNIII